MATRARYRQVADKLAARIVSGDIPVGARMPGKRQVAEDEGVSVGTVEKALDVLAGWGLTESAQGVGVFVISCEPVATMTTEQRLADLEARVQMLEQRAERPQG